MKKYTYQAKTFAEAKNQAMADLMEQEENLYIKEIESTNKLFNKKSVIEVIKKDDVVEAIKELIKGIVTDMGLTVNMEVKKREDSLNITLYTDNNAVLIGKNARTLDALTTVIKQSLYKDLGESYKFVLDIGEYKQKREWNLEKMAKSIAREVAKTKVEAKLEPMNSYERRIIHNTLGQNKKVYTESVGEEPNRCVVIKPKEVIEN
ncbi:MAG: RNA-binding cell elongation regulator Jag/EloR [Bacilli bacterium]